MATIKINTDGNIEITGSGFNRELTLANNRITFDAPTKINDKSTLSRITNIQQDKLNNPSNPSKLSSNSLPFKGIQTQSISGNELTASSNLVNVIKDYSGNKSSTFFNSPNTNFGPESILEANAQQKNYMDFGNITTEGNVLFEMHEFWPEVGYQVIPTSGSNYTGSGYFTNQGGLTAYEYDAVNVKKAKPYWWSSDSENGYVKEKNNLSEHIINFGDAHFASPNVRLKRNYIPNIFKIGLLHHSIFQTAGYPLEYTEVSGAIKPPKLLDTVISSSKTTLNSNGTTNENLNAIYKDFVFDSMQIGDPVKITYGLWSGSKGYDSNGNSFDLLWGFAGSWESSGFKRKGVFSDSRQGNGFDYTGDVFKNTLKHNFPFFENEEYKIEAIKQFAEWTHHVAFADQNPLTPSFQSTIDPINIASDTIRNYYRYGRYYWTDGATGWIQGATDPGTVDVEKFDDYGIEPGYKLNTVTKKQIAPETPISTLSDYRNLSELNKYNTLRYIDINGVLSGAPNKLSLSLNPTVFAEVASVPSKYTTEKYANYDKVKNYVKFLKSKGIYLVTGEWITPTCIGFKPGRLVSLNIPTKHSFIESNSYEIEIQLRILQNTSKIESYRAGQFSVELNENGTKKGKLTLQQKEGEATFTTWDINGQQRQALYADVNILTHTAYIEAIENPYNSGILSGHLEIGNAFLDTPQQTILASEPVLSPAYQIPILPNNQANDPDNPLYSNTDWYQWGSVQDEIDGFKKILNTPYGIATDWQYNTENLDFYGLYQTVTDLTLDSQLGIEYPKYKSLRKLSIWNYYTGINENTPYILGGPGNQNQTPCMVDEDPCPPMEISSDTAVLLLIAEPPFMGVFLYDLKTNVIKKILNIVAPYTPDYNHYSCAIASNVDNTTNPPSIYFYVLDNTQFPYGENVRVRKYNMSGTLVDTIDVIIPGYETFIFGAAITDDNILYFASGNNVYEADLNAPTPTATLIINLPNGGILQGDVVYIPDQTTPRLVITYRESGNSSIAIYSLENYPINPITLEDTFLIRDVNNNQVDNLYGAFTEYNPLTGAYNLGGFITSAGDVVTRNNDTTGYVTIIGNLISSTYDQYQWGEIASVSDATQVYGAKFYVPRDCNDGSSGTSGTSGASGTSGTSGSSGRSNSSGKSGLTGSNGSSGKSNVNGLSGVSETSASSGKNGSSALSEISGNSGSSGEAGTSGSSGEGGTSGSSGKAGTSGSSGISGTAGQSGTNGTSGMSNKSGISGSSGTLRGILQCDPTEPDLTKRSLLDKQDFETTPFLYINNLNYVSQTGINRNQIETVGNDNIFVNKKVKIQYIDSCSYESIIPVDICEDFRALVITGSISAYLDLNVTHDPLKTISGIPLEDAYGGYFVSGNFADQTLYCLDERNNILGLRNVNRISSTLIQQLKAGSIFPSLDLPACSYLNKTIFGTDNTLAGEDNFVETTGLYNQIVSRSIAIGGSSQKASNGFPSIENLMVSGDEVILHDKPELLYWDSAIASHSVQYSLNNDFECGAFLYDIDQNYLDWKFGPYPSETAYGLETPSSTNYSQSKLYGDCSLRVTFVYSSSREIAISPYTNQYEIYEYNMANPYHIQDFIYNRIPGTTEQSASLQYYSTNNVYLGHTSAYSTEIANNNTIIGNYSLFTGSGIVFSGDDVVSKPSRNNFTSLGYKSIYNLNRSMQQNNFYEALVDFAILQGTIAEVNIAIGANTQETIHVDRNNLSNIAIGYKSQNLISGSNNLSIGVNSLINSFDYNSGSVYSNRNTVIGNYTLNKFGTVGAGTLLPGNRLSNLYDKVEDNTFIGTQLFFYNTSASTEVPGASLASGVNSTAIGNYNFLGITNISGSTVIGSENIIKGRYIRDLTSTTIVGIGILANAKNRIGGVYTDQFEPTIGVSYSNIYNNTIIGVNSFVSVSLNQYNNFENIRFHGNTLIGSKTFKDSNSTISESVIIGTNSGKEIVRLFNPFTGTNEVSNNVLIGNDSYDAVVLKNSTLIGNKSANYALLGFINNPTQSILWNTVLIGNNIIPSLDSQVHVGHNTVHGFGYSGFFSTPHEPVLSTTIGHNILEKGYYSQLSSSFVDNNFGFSNQFYTLIGNNVARYILDHRDPSSKTTLDNYHDLESKSDINSFKKSLLVIGHNSVVGNQGTELNPVPSILRGSILVIGNNSYINPRVDTIDNGGSYSFDETTITLDNSYEMNSIIAIGHKTLENDLSGSVNIAIGNYASNYETFANYNISIGYESLYTNISGSNTIAIGDKVAFYQKNNDNIIVGNNAGYSKNIFYVSEGVPSISNRGKYPKENVLLGHYAGYELGSYVFSENTGTANVIIGTQLHSDYGTASGSFVDPAGTVYNYNFLNTPYSRHPEFIDGDYPNDDTRNVQTLPSTLNDGNKNIAFGEGTLSKLTSGNNNVAFGFQVFWRGIIPTFQGTTPGYAPSASDSWNLPAGDAADNVALGYRSLLYGSRNNEVVSIGNLALTYDEYGSGSIAVGYKAIGNSIRSNLYQIAIGANSLNRITNEQNISIGYNAHHNDGTQAITNVKNTIVIGENSNLNAISPLRTTDKQDDIIIIGSLANTNENPTITSDISGLGFTPLVNYEIDFNNYPVSSPVLVTNPTQSVNQTYVGTVGYVHNPSTAGFTNLVKNSKLYSRDTIAIGPEVLNEATTSDNIIAIGANAMSNYGFADLYYSKYTSYVNSVGSTKLVTPYSLGKAKNELPVYPINSIAIGNNAIRWTGEYHYDAYHTDFGLPSIIPTGSGTVTVDTLTFGMTEATELLIDEYAMVTGSTVNIKIDTSIYTVNKTITYNLQDKIEYVAYLVDGATTLLVSNELYDNAVADDDMPNINSELFPFVTEDGSHYLKPFTRATIYDGAGFAGLDPSEDPISSLPLLIDYIKLGILSAEELEQISSIIDNTTINFGPTNNKAEILGKTLKNNIAVGHGASAGRLNSTVTWIKNLGQQFVIPEYANVIYGLYTGGTFEGNSYKYAKEYHGEENIVIGNDAQQGSHVYNTVTIGLRSSDSTIPNAVFLQGRYNPSNIRPSGLVFTNDQRISAAVVYNIASTANIGSGIGYYLNNTSLGYENLRYRPGLSTGSILPSGFCALEVESFTSNGILHNSTNNVAIGYRAIPTTHNTQKHVGIGTETFFMLGSDPRESNTLSSSIAIGTQTAKYYSATIVNLQGLRSIENSSAGIVFGSTLGSSHGRNILIGELIGDRNGRFFNDSVIIGHKSYPYGSEKNISIGNYINEYESLTGSLESFLSSSLTESGSLKHNSNITIGYYNYSKLPSGSIVTVGEGSMVKGNSTQISESITIGTNALQYGEILNQTIVVGNRNFSQFGPGPETRLYFNSSSGNIVYLTGYEDEANAFSHNTVSYYNSNYKLIKTGSGADYKEIPSGTFAPVISIGQNLTRFVNDVGQNLNESSFLNIGHNTKYFSRTLSSPYENEYIFEDGNFDNLLDGGIFYATHRTIPINIYWNVAPKINHEQYESNLKRQNSTEFPGGQFPTQIVSESTYWIAPVVNTSIKTGSNINVILGNNVLNLENKYPATSVILSSFIPNVYDPDTDEITNWSYFGFQDNIILGNNSFVGKFDDYFYGIHDWIVSGSRFKLFPTETSGVQNDWYTVDNYNYQYGIVHNNINIGHDNAIRLARASNILLGNNNLNNTSILANVFTNNLSSGKFVTKADDAFSREVLSVAWNPGDVLAYPSEYLSMDPYAGKEILVFGFNQLNNVTASNVIMFGQNLPSASIVSNLIMAGNNNLNYAAYTRNDIIFGKYNISSSANAITKSDSFENIIFGNYNLNVASHSVVTSSYLTNNLVFGQTTGNINKFSGSANRNIIVKDNILIGNNSAKNLGAYSFNNLIIGNSTLSEVSGNIGQTVDSFIIGDLSAHDIAYRPDPLYKNVVFGQVSLNQLDKYGFNYPSMYSQYIGHGVSYSGSLDINTIVVGNKAFVSQSEYDSNNIIIGYKSGRNKPAQYAILVPDEILIDKLEYVNYDWFESRVTGTVTIKKENITVDGNDSTEPSGLFMSDTLKDSIILGNLGLYNTRFYQYAVKRSNWISGSDATFDYKPNASLIAIGERVLSNTQYEYDSNIHTIAIGSEVGHNRHIISVDQKIYDSIILGAKSATVNTISHSVIIGANTVAVSQSIQEYQDLLRVTPLYRPAHLPIVQDSIIIGTKNINLSGSVLTDDNTAYWLPNEFDPNDGMPFIGGIGDNTTGTATAIENSYTASKYVDNIVIGNNTLLSHRYYTKYTLEITTPPVSSEVTFVTNSIVKNNILIGNSVASKLYLGQSNTIIGNESGMRLQSGYNLTLLGYGVAQKARHIQWLTTQDSEYSGFFGAPAQSESLGLDNDFGLGIKPDNNYYYNPHFDTTAFGYHAYKTAASIWRETGIGARVFENKSTYRTSPFDNTTNLNTYQPIRDDNGNRIINAVNPLNNNIESDVAIGYKAGADLKMGEMNVYIGAEAGNTQAEPNYPALDDALSVNNIVIGYNSLKSELDVANEITIGNNAHASARLMGANGWWYVQSDSRDKTVTSSFNVGVEFINKLNPKSYKWDSRYFYASGSGSNGDYSSSYYYVGFIAQEISRSVSELSGSILPNWYYNKASASNFDNSTTYEKLEIFTDNLIYPIINSVKQLALKFDGTSQTSIAGTFGGNINADTLESTGITLNSSGIPAVSSESILIQTSLKTNLVSNVTTLEATPTMSMVLTNLSSAPTSSKFVNVINYNVLLTGIGNDGVTVKTTNIELETVYTINSESINILTSSIIPYNNDLSASISVQALGKTVIARINSQNNDWNYVGYTGSYSVASSFKLTTADLNSSGKVYKPN